MIVNAKIGELSEYPLKKSLFSLSFVKKYDAIIPVGIPPIIGANTGPNKLDINFEPAITEPPIKNSFK
jgi:hypothetical protein